MGVLKKHLLSLLSLSVHSILTRQRSHCVAVDRVLNVVRRRVGALLVLALVLVENPKEEDVLVVDANLVPRLV